MADEVKLGIIGVGQIGKSHLKRYQEVAGARIVAACDTNEAELQRVAAEYNIPNTFTDFRQLLAMDEIVAVDVCLHNNLHAPVSIAAMEAGKNVYCEKPLAGSYADARRMVETADKLGRKLSMQLGSLYSNETAAAKRLIQDGHLGQPYYAKSSYYRRRGRPFVDGYGTYSFVRKETAAGGALFDMGVYHISQILYLLDNPEVLTVSGATHQEVDMYEDRRREGRYDVEELGLALVRLARRHNVLHRGGLGHPPERHGRQQDSGQQGRADAESVRLPHDDERHRDGRPLRPGRRADALGARLPGADGRLPQRAAPLGGGAAGQGGTAADGPHRPEHDADQRGRLPLAEARPRGDGGRGGGEVRPDGPRTLSRRHRSEGGAHAPSAPPLTTKPRRPDPNGPGRLSDALRTACVVNAVSYRCR